MVSAWGCALLRVACVSAVEAGMVRLTAYVTADNRPVHRWLHRHGARREDDRFVIALPGKLSADPPLRGSMATSARILGPFESRPLRGSQLPAGGRPRDVLEALCSAGVAPFPQTSSSTSSGPSRQPRLDVAAVHTVVARLRRQFGAELIDREHGGYLVPDAVRTDVDEVLPVARRPGRAPRSATGRGGVRRIGSPEPLGRSGGSRGCS